MHHEENPRRLHICMPRATGAWAIVLGLVVLVMAGPTRAQPIDIPATWGGDFWSRPRLTGSWGGCGTNSARKAWCWTSTCGRRSRAWQAAGGTRSHVLGLAEYTLNVDTQKLGLWPGGFLRVQGLSGFGQNIDHASGALIPPSLVSLFRSPGRRRLA